MRKDLELNNWFNQKLRSFLSWSNNNKVNTEVKHTWRCSTCNQDNIMSFHFDLLSVAQLWSLLKHNRLNHCLWVQKSGLDYQALKATKLQSENFKSKQKTKSFKNLFFFLLKSWCLWDSKSVLKFLEAGISNQKFQNKKLLDLKKISILSLM